MPLTSINGSFERTGIGQLFLAAYPATDPGASIAARVQGYFAKFYTDGLANKVLTGGVKPWANLDANGIKVKVKQNRVEYDPNNGPKHAVGVQDCEMSLEFGFADVDPAHLADAFGATTEELIAQAAATGKAGRSQVLLGGQTTLVKYTALYRMPSALIPGEFDHYLFPRILFAVEADFDLNKKSVLTCKLKADALPDIYLLNNAGLGEQCIADIANAAAM